MGVVLRHSRKTQNTAQLSHPKSNNMTRVILLNICLAFSFAVSLVSVVMSVEPENFTTLVTIAVTMAVIAAVVTIVINCCLSIA
jgi:heme/copper-type cytochrome/quinol oxidase subunit 2